MPGADPEDRVAEAEVVLELELREAHVHAVEVRDHVDEEEERDEPARGLLEGPFLESHAPTLTARCYFTMSFMAERSSSPSPEVPATSALSGSRYGFALCQSASFAGLGRLDQVEDRLRQHVERDVVVAERVASPA